MEEQKAPEILQLPVAPPVDDPNFEALLKSMFQLIDGILNSGKKEKDTGFSLFVYSAGQEGEPQKRWYVSNVKREAAVPVLREFLKSHAKILRSKLRRKNAKSD